MHYSYLKQIVSGLNKYVYNIPSILSPNPVRPCLKPSPRPAGFFLLHSSCLSLCSESSDSRSMFRETLVAKFVTEVKAPGIDLDLWTYCLNGDDEFSADWSAKVTNNLSYYTLDYTACVSHILIQCMHAILWESMVQYHITPFSLVIPQIW